MKVGIISYDFHHLKTEQIALNLQKDDRIKTITIFSLPFIERKKRDIFFNHRPDMSSGVHPKSLALLDRIEHQNWDGERPLGHLCDIFVIGGAGILNTDFSCSKPIVNAHPGLIPISRGLDSFKWAIYRGDPIGITLHLIDKQVDGGEILLTKKTNVFWEDTIFSTARRHYENEIFLLSNFLNYIENREICVEQENPATMRMNYQKEKETLKKFDEWKKIHMTK